MVRWYALRWGIECWHQVIKDVCGVETRQPKSARALERALVLDMITGWRALLLCRLGKEQPHLPAELQYSSPELAVLVDHKKKLPQWSLEAPVTSGPLPQAEPLLRPASRPNPEPATPSQEPQIPSPSSGLTLLQANLLVAMMGGFWGRRGDGDSGPKVMQRGLVLLGAIVEDRKYREQLHPKPRPPTRRARKPG